MNLTRSLSLILFLVTAPLYLQSKVSNPMAFESEALRELHAGFRNPPAEARPFVRWWWSNNQIELEQVEKELDAFKAAGIGGVEINPMLEPQYAWYGKQHSKAPMLKWLSPEWNDVLREAAKAAKCRGMIADLLGGSAWPFSGDFLKPEHTAYRVVTQYDLVEGPTKHVVSLEEVFERTPDYIHKAYKKPNHAYVELKSVQLLPQNAKTIEEAVDVEQVVSADGVLEIEIPEGKHMVAYVVIEQNFRYANNTVKGAGGPALNHYSKEATTSYLDHLFSIEDSWGEPMSNHLRAIFSDSIEIAEANYTPGMIEKFNKVHGYQLEPYLAFVLMPEDYLAKLVDLDSEQIRELRRVRYDWTRFISRIFNESFTKTLADYTAAKGMHSRHQSGGNPAFIDIEEGSMYASIPEAENWLDRSDYLDFEAFHSRDWRSHTLNVKYIAAAANLQGRPIASSESMTNVTDLFEGTLAQIKQGFDATTIGGINHTVFHGSTYTPPDVPFPGFIRFGTFFSPNNTWWPYFRLLADYNARVSYIFQRTHTASDVAVLGPTPDTWAIHGLNKFKLTSEPKYYGELWKSLAELGINNDYIHGKVLQEADVSDGLIRFGPMAYRLLFVADTRTLEPETAEAIREFAKSGGKVVFTGSTPLESPTRSESPSADAQVKNAIEEALRYGAIAVDGPGDYEELDSLRGWLDDVLDRAGFERVLDIDETKEGVYAIRQELDGEHLFFITNTYKSQPYQSHFRYAVEEKGLWSWDPKTGEVTPYGLNYDAEGFYVELAPLESLLVMTGPKKKVEARPFVYNDPVEARTFGGPWNVAFDPVNQGEPFDSTFESLVLLNEHEEERIRNFAGVATYVTEFDWEETDGTYLELGDTSDNVSEIILNGKPVGVNWYGNTRFDLSEHLLEGSNTLAVKYTTTLFNGMLDNEMFIGFRKRWHSEEQPALRPSGLLGPVRILKLGHMITLNSETAAR